MSGANPTMYANQQISFFFSSSPASGPTSCAHLPLAILQNQSTTKIEALIDKCNGVLNKNYNQIKRITLLHISALAGNSQVLAALCPEKRSSQPVDNEKNTPLHLRAFVSESEVLSSDLWVKEYLNTCLTPDAKIRGKNAQHATPGKLFNLAHSYEKVMQETSKEYVGITTSLHQGTETKMISISENLKIQESCLDRGYRLIEEMVATPKTMIDQWLDPHTECGYIDTKTPKRTEANLIIRELPGKGCMAFAGAKIPKGTAIEYLGETLYAQTESEYMEKVSFHSGYDLQADALPASFVNPDKTRNLAPFIGDGLPNVSPNLHCNIDGLRRRVYLTTERTIKAGEEISYNYGRNHPVKYSDYTVGHYKKIQGLFKKNPACLIPLFDMHLGRLLFVNHPSKHFAFAYILETPAVLFKLAADGTFPMDQIAAVMDKFSNAPEELQEVHTQSTLSMLKIAHLISQAKEKLSEMGESKSFDQIMQIANKNTRRVTKIPMEVAGPRLGKHAFIQFFKSSFENLLQGLRRGNTGQEAVSTFYNDFVTENLPADASSSNFATY